MITKWCNLCTLGVVARNVSWNCKKIANEYLLFKWGGDAIIELDIRLEVDIMKKKILLLAMLMTLTSLTSCGYNKEITCQDVINVYEEAGYSVFHSELTDQENGG